MYTHTYTHTTHKYIILKNSKNSIKISGTFNIYNC